MEEHKGKRLKICGTARERTEEKDKCQDKEPGKGNGVQVKECREEQREDVMSFHEASKRET